MVNGILSPVQGHLKLRCFVLTTASKLGKLESTQRVQTFKRLISTSEVIRHTRAIQIRLLLLLLLLVLVLRMLLSAVGFS